MLAFSMTLLMLVLLALGTPLAISLALAGILGLYIVGGVSMVLGIMDTTPVSTVNSYELVTIPMFLLMAEFVVLSRVADDLFKATTTWVGRVPGGLAIATALAGAGFGAICGSSTASAATLAKTTIPAMLKENYEPKLACGVVAISGTLAMLVPPSVALVLFGILADISISDLLIGGVIPGVLVTLAIILTVLYLVWRDPSRAPLGKRYTMQEKISSLGVVWPMLLLLTAVTGIIYLGVATPTEASGIGAFGAFLIALWRGKATLSATLQTLQRAAKTTAMILLIMLGAHFFSYFFTVTQATQQIVATVGDLPVDRWIIMTCILIIYLILGLFMDQIGVLVLTTPVMLPLILSLGFDPVWFGVLVIVVAEVGMVTPPVGMNVFVISRFTGRPLDEIFHGVAPHVVAHLIVIALFCVFPQIILWLPQTMLH